MVLRQGNIENLRTLSGSNLKQEPFVTILSDDFLWVCPWQGTRVLWKVERQAILSGHRTLSESIN